MPESKKILIIEDDAMLREMYEAKFKAEGFEALTADNGGDGLVLAQTQLPAFILLDIILPQMDGFMVLEALKADERTKAVPVIMLTNLGTDEDRAKGERLGAVDYLIKANLTPDQIAQAVKKRL